MNLRLFIFVLLAAFSSAAIASEAEIAAALRAKGAEVTETKGGISGLTFKSVSSLTAADYALIHQLLRLKSLSCGIGLDDAALKALAGLPALEMLSTNGMSASDEGIGSLASLKTLHSIAFFHPGKAFTGRGLAALAGLPKLERLTVAGSTEFGDEGMSAVSKLTQLKEFRTWHNGVTVEGVKPLQAMPGLKSLTLGQRLANAPPPGVSDETLAVLAGIKSLEMISVQEARLSLKALSQLAALPKLKKLALDGVEIPEADIASLRQQLPHTEVLWTAPNEVAKKRIQSVFGH
jgi:hypothetical protein